MEKTSLSNRIRQLFLGTSSKRTIFVILWTTVILFLIGNVVSYLFYLKTNGSYSILLESVSSLGNQIDNPQGSLIWRLTFLITGFLIIPVINFIYCRLQPTANITSKMFRWMAIFASLGVSGVGIFPENKGAIHYIFAFLAFFGYMYAFCCNIYTFRKIAKEKRPRFSVIPIIIMYFILIGGVGGFLISFALFGLWYFYDIYLINPRLPLWEWLSFIAELFYLLVCFHIVANLGKKEIN